ncbi:hypothetical protein [Ralstonia pseudosolanacearum]|uniref:hypothetical protein n=1 Tax=Ralstonia pseudosolanacearum TaxID=1310165 RepID=UPI0005C5531E|nr:hypothetical protein [Ralstonia pseudosolanacearum]QKL51894.1 hypothetical protein HI816_08465 [Ralstonia solanacearum]QKM23149.1 hypothetical protein HI796_08460 [Ralstonia solanacearum]QKM27957.1 hypothetical protein HI795_08465 [Ralstonia solanacearum]
MDLATITGAYQGLKAAKELVGGLIDAKVDSEAKARIYEAQAKLGSVQDVLFSMREEMFELQDENKRLKEQLAEAEEWRAKVLQYELVTTAGGAVVYRFKGQPEHYACPSCFGSKQLHILQTRRTRHGNYTCTGCKTDFPVEPQKPMQMPNMAR